MSPANLENVSNDWHKEVVSYKDEQSEARTRFYTKKALLSLQIGVRDRNATTKLDDALNQSRGIKSFKDLSTGMPGEQFPVKPGSKISKMLKLYFEHSMHLDQASLNRNLAVTYYYFDKQGFNLDEIYIGETVRFPGDGTIRIFDKSGNERGKYDLRPRTGDADEGHDADGVQLPPEKQQVPKEKKLEDLPARREVEPPHDLPPPPQSQPPSEIDPPAPPPQPPTTAPSEGPPENRDGNDPNSEY